MKKIQALIILTAIAAVMAVSISACAPAASEENSSSSSVSEILPEDESSLETGSETEESSVAETDIDENDDSAADPDDNSDDGDDEDTEDPDKEDIPASSDKGEALPDVDGSDDFKAAFKDNSIDTDYMKQSKVSGSVVEMVKINNGAADNWKKVVASAYKELLKLDASVEEEQQEWKDGLSDKFNEIRDQVTASGSFANVEISHNTMLVYRERAAELLEDIFEATGDISGYFSTGDANG